MTALARPMGANRPPPALTAITFAVVAALALAAGAGPVQAYVQIVVGALRPDNLVNTLS